MRSRTNAGILTALAVAVTACQMGPASLSDEDVLGIRQASNAWVYHVRRADWQSLMVVYAEDAIYMPPNAPAVRGRDAIKAFLAELPPMAEYTMTIDEIDGRGDLAFVRGSYTMTLVRADSPAPVADWGKFIEIRRRQADGAWLIAANIFNSDLRVPE